MQWYQRRVHGESEWRSVIMKFLLVLSLVAATQAEADPAFAYGFGGHFLPYAVHHAPIVHAPVLYTHHTGCTNNAGALVPCALGGAVLGVAPVAAAAPAEEAAAPVEASIGRRERLRPSPRLKLMLRLTLGCITLPTDTGLLDTL